MHKNYHIKKNISKTVFVNGIKSFQYDETSISRFGDINVKPYTVHISTY